MMKSLVSLSRLSPASTSTLIRKRCTLLFSYGSTKNPPLDVINLQKQHSIATLRTSRSRLCNDASEHRNNQQLRRVNSTCNETPESKNKDDEWDTLLLEARHITLSFWRTCIRCIRLLRDVDPPDSDKDSPLDFAVLLPNKNNEAKEMQKKWRSDYYLDWASESIFQESDCLNNKWTQQSIDRYLFFIRQGEEKRQWLLKDFKIEKDPYSFDHDRVLRFEKRAYLLLANRLNKVTSIHQHSEEQEEDDDFWDDDDIDKRR